MEIRDRITDLRRVPASELLPNPKNWRTHPVAQQDAMRGILAEVGIADAVLARETPDGLMLIDGHLRADVAPDTVWPVLVLDVDESEADLILATHDPLAAMAETNSEHLDTLLQSASTNNEALQAMLAELASDAGLYETPEIVEDKVPEPPTDLITQPGDLWILGAHRVLCGDSTKAEDVARLMDGETYGAFITDPPYGIKHSGKGIAGATNANDFGTIEGDGSTEAAVTVLSGADWSIPAIVWGANYFPAMFPDGYGWIVWDKQREGETYSGAEIAFSNTGARVDVFRHQWHGMIKASEHGEPRVHATQKPVALMGYCIQKSGGVGVVYDPFLGSGTTLIAAEQLGRKCYGLEISCAYSDVICQRWSALTDRQPVLERTGETFDQVRDRLTKESEYATT